VLKLITGNGYSIKTVAWKVVPKTES
jgi:hypothetical protein